MDIPSTKEEILNCLECTHKHEQKRQYVVKAENFQGRQDLCDIFNDGDNVPIDSNLHIRTCEKCAEAIGSLLELLLADGQKAPESDNMFKIRPYPEPLFLIPI